LSTNTIYMIVIVVVFIGLFYFMGIRPQAKQRKAHDEMMSSLAKGDVVMTGSGIYGRVVRTDDKVVEVEIAKGVTMKVARRAIADIIRDKERAKALAPSVSGLKGPRSAQGALGGQTGAAGTDDTEDDGADT
jgi:preprotein translocase subunit YajC